jgi:hypothetical protein
MKKFISITLFALVCAILISGYISAKEAENKLVEKAEGNNSVAIQK